MLPFLVGLCLFLLNQTNWVYGSIVNSLTHGFEQIDDILKAQQVDSPLHKIHK